MASLYLSMHLEGRKVAEEEEDSPQVAEVVLSSREVVEEELVTLAAVAALLMHRYAHSRGARPSFCPIQRSQGYTGELIGAWESESLSNHSAVNCQNMSTAATRYGGWGEPTMQFCPP